VEYLHDALDKRNLAEAEAVRLEFSHREDREAHGAAFGALLSALPIPDAAAVRGKLSRIAGAVLEADKAITGFSRAQTDPMARLAVYRARGAQKGGAEQKSHGEGPCGGEDALLPSR
jgi:hypothetical protein